MKHFSKIIGSAALATLVIAGPAFAEIHLMDAWSRPSIGNSKNGATYLKMQNHGEKDDVLLEVRGGVSEKVELHNTIREGDVMRMRPVAGGITVKSGELVELAPGGFHIMMMTMKKKLSAGDSFPLTLVFKHEGEMHVDVMVKKPAAGGDHGKHKMMHKH